MYHESTSADVGQAKPWCSKRLRRAVFPGIAMSAGGQSCAHSVILSGRFAIAFLVRVETAPARSHFVFETQIESKLAILSFISRESPNRFTAPFVGNCVQFEHDKLTDDCVSH